MHLEGHNQAKRRRIANTCEILRLDTPTGTNNEKTCKISWRPGQLPVVLYATQGLFLVRGAILRKITVIPTRCSKGVHPR